MGPEVGSKLSPIASLFNGTTLFIRPPPTSEELSERQFDINDLGHITASFSTSRRHDRSFDGDMRTIKASVEAFDNEPEAEFLTATPEQESHKIPTYPLGYGCANGSSESDLLSGPFGITVNPSSFTFDDILRNNLSDVIFPRDTSTEHRSLQWHTANPEAGSSSSGIDPENKQVIRYSISCSSRLRESV